MRSPFTAQRQAIAGGMDPRHAGVLQLQREAGNKAVAQLVTAQRASAGQGTVQRAMTSRARDLGRHQRILVGTYGKIVRVLADYEGARSASERHRYVLLLLALSDTWLQKHADAKSSRERQQRDKVQLLEAECLRELSNKAAQEKYLEGFDPASQGSKWNPEVPGTAPNGQRYDQAPFDPREQFGQMGALSQGAKLNAAGPATTLAGGGTTGDTATKGADKAALKLASKYQLTAAEIAAIRTYSFPDYGYIVPASGNSRDYVQQGLAKSKDPALKRLAASSKDINMAMKEGAMHTGVLMQALGKLPPWKGKAFRGERLTEAAFNTRYEIGKVISGVTNESGAPARGYELNRFGSASRERSVADKYSRGRGSGDQEIADDQTVSVVLELELTNARDIEKLSGSPNKEAEVLTLPGAKFAITAVLDMPWPDRKLGNPIATKWALVQAKQIA
jgi:hypothetical protein